MSATRSLNATLHPRTTTRGQRNNAGGPTQVIDKWARLNRFLIIGTEGGTYYVNEKDHTLSNVAVLTECLDADPVATVTAIRTISDSGRAPKNDYAIYALAVASAHPEAKSLALRALPQVCRTGTHLFQFVSFVDSLRGWGPALRNAIANWYLTKTADQLAYQVLKYQQREGWSHRDVFRKVHPRTSDPVKNGILAYVVGKDVGTRELPVIVGAHKSIQEIEKAPLDKTDWPELLASMIEEWNLPREIIPTHLLNTLPVARSLAKTMPYTALMRNLGTLSRLGITDEIDVTSRLTDADYIKKSRVHPISILTALRTYGQGHGFRGSNDWPVNPDITRALDAAFYKAFENVEPTGKRFRIGVDVSGSMSSFYGNGILTACEIAAALSMVIVRTEPWTDVQGFASTLRPLPYTYNTRLEDAMDMGHRMNFGSTDAALLIDDATQNRLDVDVFVVITDNETYVRNRNPAQALREYRKSMNKPDAKLVVLATEATEFSIADPNDRNMLDIAGFDSSVPEVIRSFVLGDI